MAACDVCNATPGADAKRFTADQLREAVDTGYRPSAVTESFSSVAGRLGLDLGDDHWYGEWVAQVRRDRTDWLLCRSCSTELEAHMDRPAAVRADAGPQTSPRNVATPYETRGRPVSSWPVSSQRVRTGLIIGLVAVLAVLGWIVLRSG